jgi:alkylhydroperoxidase/carboxymuconolactone decarboxylase family protein YurZ
MKGDRVAVAARTREALAALSAGSAEALQAMVGLREDHRQASSLDERSFALARLAALIALDAPPACYAREVASALDAGVSSEDILGVLHAVAPQVGGPRVVAAAPEIMLALGLSLPDAGEFPANGD